MRWLASSGRPVPEIASSIAELSARVADSAGGKRVSSSRRSARRSVCGVSPAPRAYSICATFSTRACISRSGGGTSSTGAHASVAPSTPAAISFRARFLHFLPNVLALVAPAVVTVISVRALTGAHLLGFRPLLNDEVYYWHQTATAAAVGTAGGYYTVDERTPAVEAFHFGAHGPVYPLLVGAIVRFTGWHRASGPLFNLAWIAVCAVVFLALARPAPARTWLIAALLATFWPLPFWAASNMQESFHHGIAFLLAGVSVGLGRRPRAALVIAALVLPIAIMVRPSWGVVLPGIG